MTLFILALVLLALSLFGISLRRTYESLPKRELKRRARSGDQMASVLYRAVAYGASLKLLLWAFIGLTAAGGFILLTEVAPAPLAFLAVAGLLWYGFGWMPGRQAGETGTRLTAAITPYIVWLLSYLHPVLDRIAGLAKNHRPITFHTGVYERDDLLELIEKQRQLPDSRIPPEELDVVLHALSFGELMVAEVMVPRRAVTMVAESDVSGPILMKELHDSGHSRFPVYGDSKDQITGTLYLRQALEAKHGEKVKDIRRPDVYYVHEDASLYQVLDAFIKTKHHLFVVVNSFEEFTGIITIEDVIEQVIGRKIQDEFDRYEDIRSVAKSQADKEHKARKHIPETETEVVE